MDASTICARAIFSFICGLVMIVLRSEIYVFSFSYVFIMNAICRDDASTAFLSSFCLFYDDGVLLKLSSSFFSCAISSAIDVSLHVYVCFILS